MKSISLLVGGAMVLAIVSPANARKSDQVMIENMRARIFAVRSEIDANGAGSVELAEAESRLHDLARALDHNKAGDARASINGIETLMAAARARAHASLRTSEAVPTRWTPTPSAAPIRKRISFHKPLQAKSGCRIASR